MTDTKPASSVSLRDRLKQYQNLKDSNQSKSYRTNTADQELTEISKQSPMQTSLKSFQAADSDHSQGTGSWAGPPRAPQLDTTPIAATPKAPVPQPDPSAAKQDTRWVPMSLRVGRASGIIPEPKDEEAKVAEPESWAPPPAAAARTAQLAIAAAPSPPPADAAGDNVEEEIIEEEIVEEEVVEEEVIDEEIEEEVIEEEEVVENEEMIFESEDGEEIIEDDEEYPFESSDAGDDIFELASNQTSVHRDDDETPDDEPGMIPMITRANTHDDDEDETIIEEETDHEEVEEPQDGEDTSNDAAMAAALGAADADNVEAGFAEGEVDFDHEDFKDEDVVDVETGFAASEDQIDDQEQIEMVLDDSDLDSNPVLALAAVGGAAPAAVALSNGDAPDESAPDLETGVKPRSTTAPKSAVAPESAKADSDAANSKRYKCLCLGLVIVALLAIAAIVLPLYIDECDLRGNDCSDVTRDIDSLTTPAPVEPLATLAPIVTPTAPSAPSPAPVSSPTNPPVLTPTTPTESPSQAPTSQRLKQFIEQYLFVVSGEEVFQDQSSPQYRAAVFLANEDEFASQLSSVGNLDDRYAAVVFYFATGGDNWDACFRDDPNCTDPEEGPWLNGDHCNWFSITCGGDPVDPRVTTISFCTFTLKPCSKTTVNSIVNLTNVLSLPLR
jgi:hypothetical protein